MKIPLWKKRDSYNIRWVDVGTSPTEKETKLFMSGIRVLVFV
jgi:hypothetical protein